MAFKKLTEEGKNFIRTIVNKDGANATTKLSGRNKWNLKFSNLENTPTTFTSNAIDQNGNPITTNGQLAKALIYWYNKYAAEYELDANILAAQAYQESNFNIWTYAATSTASGISQFIGVTFYDVVMNNLGSAPHFSTEEKNKLTVGMTSPTLQSSYKNYSSGSIAKNNRSILHQNIIDNPGLMIKAQAKLMKYISDRNGGLASNALFAYNRGSGLRSDNYLGLINLTASKFGNEYIKEGVDYVEKIFGYLGDKNNQRIAKLGKPRGVWFGYDIDFDFENFNANLG